MGANQLLDRHHRPRDQNGRCRHCPFPVEIIQVSLTDDVVAVHRRADMTKVRSWLKWQRKLGDQEKAVYGALAHLSSLPGEQPTFRALMEELARSGSSLGVGSVWKILYTEESQWDRVEISVRMLIDGRSIPTESPDHT